MDWKHYLAAMLIFNALGLLVVFTIQQLQWYLPFNPQQLKAPSIDLAINTAVSFVTNTNWQAKAPEITFSYFTQMLAFTSQNFLSAATGMCLLIALIRGIEKQERNNLGNFWVDMIRSVLYILLPLSFILALILISQGVIQTLLPNQKIELIQPLTYTHQTETKTLNTQTIPMGPVASQVAIAQLGTNGGGFFNTNAAHPFANPTPITNALEMLSILLIPASLCCTFGIMVRDKRQGWAILATMFILFIPFVFGAVMLEQQGNPVFNAINIDQLAKPDQAPGGNMEGKETRFGIVSSAIWATSTTAAANGSVNSMLDSYTPLGGLIPLWMMLSGEVIFGGVGSGLYGMVLFIMLAVFIGGLMVGRTPEYLGKKIEPHEMKMISIAILIMPLLVLFSTALAAITQAGTSAIGNKGIHGFTEMLYAFASMANNNGSALSGLNANTPFYNLLGSLVMLIGRFGVAIPALAIAGSLVKKKKMPSNSGTLQTHTPLFIALLIGVILILGALTCLPALALGPIVEQLIIWRQYGH